MVSRFVRRSDYGVARGKELTYDPAFLGLVNQRLSAQQSWKKCEGILLGMCSSGNVASKLKLRCFLRSLPWPQIDKEVASESWWAVGTSYSTFTWPDSLVKHSVGFLLLYRRRCRL